MCVLWQPHIVITLGPSDRFGSSMHPSRINPFFIPGQSYPPELLYIPDHLGIYFTAVAIPTSWQLQWHAGLFIAIIIVIDNGLSGGIGSFR